MNEIVKYSNKINKIQFTNFNSNDLNLFMKICVILKEKGNEKFEIPFGELKESISYIGHKKQFIKLLDSMTDKIGIIKIWTEDGFDKIFLFKRCKAVVSREVLKIELNKEYIEFFVELQKQYTMFELREFIELKSRYSKNLYRLLKQWRTIGQYTFHSLEEFRELMDIPTTYTNKYMMNECVNVAVAEIQKLDKSFQDFKCQPIYAQKRGKPLEKLQFTWKPDTVPAQFPKEQQDHLQGQEAFSDVQTFDEYMKGYQGKDKPSPVAIKIAQDIEKGNKKKKSEPQNKFNNFHQRKYTQEFWDELERMEYEKYLLTINHNSTSSANQE